MFWKMEFYEKRKMFLYLINISWGKFRKEFNWNESEQF